jgi:hypothetical protein
VLQEKPATIRPAIADHATYRLQAPEGALACEPEKTWHLRIGEQQLGPLTTDIIRGRLAAGELPSDALLWREGWEAWQLAHQLFPKFFSSASA